MGAFFSSPGQVGSWVCVFKKRSQPLMSDVEKGKKKKTTQFLCITFIHLKLDTFPELSHRTWVPIQNKDEVLSRKYLLWDKFDGYLLWQLEKNLGWNLWKTHHSIS